MATERAHRSIRAAESLNFRRSTRRRSRRSSSGSRSSSSRSTSSSRGWRSRASAASSRRGAAVEGDLAEANRLKEQSDAALKAYEKSLADARNRAQALANETRDKLNAEAEEARKKLEAELNAKLAEAEKTIAATKTAAMANVHGIAVDTAAAIVSG